MAIYHLSLKPISRSTGRSSTGAAAYRSATRIVDERTGEVFDYRKKRGIEQAEIVMPAGCTWEPSRSELWNSAELAEKRKDSCCAREHEVALPKELTSEQRLSLAREYAADLSNRHGCAVDFSIHRPRDDAAPVAENWHAHVLCTTRKVDGNGLGRKCEREQAGRRRAEDLKAERQRWEEICNKHLAAAGIAEQVDCRSLVDQGVVDREPSTHQGPAVSAMRRSQRSSRRADDQQAEKHAAAQKAQQRQAAEAARDAKATQRLHRRIKREPNRLHGEDAGNRFARLDGLTKEDRKGGSVSVWRFPPQGGAKLGAVAIVDRGDSISLPKTSDSRVGAAIALAKEKGWESLVLTGSDEFKQKAAAAAFRAGLSVESPEMQDYINELRKKAEAEQQKAPAALTAHPPRAVATAQVPALPKPQENALAGISPAQLGERTRQVSSALERQKAALRYADSIGYAAQCNKEKHLKNQLAHEKARIIKDGQILRGVFAAHSSIRFGEALETAQAERKKAVLEIQEINQKHTLGRLLSARKRRDAERRIADAVRREQAAQRQIEKIEEASKSMADPKMREAYRRWAIARMKEHNGDIARLEKLTAEAREERARTERKADFSPGEYQRLGEEKKRLQGLGDALGADARRQYDAARDPETERRRKEDEADTQRRLRQIRESNAARARSTKSPSAPSM